MSSILPVAFDGIAYASWLFLISAGLTLIYGVMRILNVAHGSLYALGAYAASSLAGVWLGSGLPAAGSFAMLLLAAILVGCLVGPLIERGLLQWMYGKDEVVLVLITYAVFLIIEDVIKLVWGVDSLLLPEPYALPGNFLLGDLPYPVYNVLLIAMALATGLALAWALYRTRQGKLLLAVIHDREMSMAMGINVSRVTLDLDRGIYHENFNIEKRDKLLRERCDDVEQKQWLDREQWFVLRARRPDVSARDLARRYGLEELRDYISRSRREIDRRRGSRPVGEST